MAAGWIKLYRQVLDNPVVCKDSDYFAVWCYLLLNAAHQPKAVLFNGKSMDLLPGQLLTSRVKISEKFNIPASKVQRILKTLENEHQIEQQTGNKNRLITVLGWHRYQESEQQNEQQVNINCTPTEHQVNTKQEVKEYKNDNNIINNNPPLSPQGEREEWHARFEKPLADKLDEWLEYKRGRRQNYKPPALKALLNKAEKAAADCGTMAVVDTIDYSMANNYQGIVWDKLAGGCAGTKMAGRAGTKASRSTTQENFKSVKQEPEDGYSSAFWDALLEDEQRQRDEMEKILKEKTHGY